MVSVPFGCRVNRLQAACMGVFTFIFVLMSMMLNTWEEAPDINVTSRRYQRQHPRHNTALQLVEKSHVDDIAIEKPYFTIKPMPAPPNSYDPAKVTLPMYLKIKNHKEKYMDSGNRRIQLKKMVQQHQINKLVEESLNSWNITLVKKKHVKAKQPKINDICDVNCKVGVPCEYNNEVDFRIIVLTFDRPSSLAKCLSAILKLHTQNHAVAVDIWIDRAKSGKVNQDTVVVANSFKMRFRSKGRACVHIRERNAYVGGQWIDTWRPKENTKEISLIVEDDIDISPYAYYWLREVNKKFGGRNDIAGYTLQMEHTFFFRGMGDHLAGPEDDTVFLYGVLGTWGFAPHPQRWREFQNWFHGKNSALKPYVPDLLPTLWYKHAESIGTQETMWEMWHIYYTHNNKLSTVYCNLHVNAQRSDVFLSLNRKEKGLHWSGKEKSDGPQNRSLLTTWNEDFVKFKNKTAKYEYDNTIVGYV